MKRVIVTIIGLCLVPGLAWVYWPVASHDRDWREEVSRLAKVSWRSDSAFTIDNVRNWVFGPGGPKEKRWERHDYDLGALTAVWFAMNPFGPWNGIAHTQLIFEFNESAGNRFLGVSIEARKESDEDYSAFLGTFGKFEKLNVWATERDLYSRIALQNGEDVYLYKIEIDKSAARKVIRAMLRKTVEIEQSPKLYNTLFGNCTSSLADAVNKPDTIIPWHYSFILTGFSDAYLHELNLLGDQSTQFESIRAKARTTDRITKTVALGPNAFSLAIRSEIKTKLR